MKVANSIKIEEDTSKEDESWSEADPLPPKRTAVMSKNPKAMKRMVVQEFMESRVSSLVRVLIVNRMQCELLITLLKQEHSVLSAL